jgi:hypothetical protein
LTPELLPDQVIRAAFLALNQTTAKSDTHVMLGK